MGLTLDLCLTLGWGIILGWVLALALVLGLVLFLVLGLAFGLVWDLILEVVGFFIFCWAFSFSIMFLTISFRFPIMFLLERGLSGASSIFFFSTGAVVVFPSLGEVLLVEVPRGVDFSSSSSSELLSSYSSFSLLKRSKSSSAAISQTCKAIQTLSLIQFSACSF